MQLQLEAYTEQKKRWPQQGRVILAQYDSDTVTVYQAYNAKIGHFAAQHGYFGGDFKFTRMSWIKTNFLWMMYRSGWGTKPDQEVTLAITIQRSAFEYILSQVGAASACVRLQWDPDHDPAGGDCRRRALQLGLRGPVLEKFAKEWIVRIEDISDFVAQQRQHLYDVKRRTQLGENCDGLMVPRETVYEVGNAAVAARLAGSAQM